MRFLRLCLIVLATLLLATNGYAWSVNQTAQNKTGSGTSSSKAFGSAVPSGHPVLGYVFYTTSTTNVITSIQSNQGDTCNIVDFGTTSGFGFASFNCGALTSGPTTFTVNVSVSQTNLWIGIDDITPNAGTVALDGHNVGIGAAAVCNSGNFTTTHNNDFVYSSIVDASGNPGSGFTLIQTGSNFNSEFLTLATAGTTAGTWTAVSGAAVCTGLALSATVGGGGNNGGYLPLVGVGD